jgi:DDE superfamily endonuclease/Helix-turn-helix of DDE superfamily endonuclease
MSQAARLKKSPSSFRLLTGITPQKFDALLAEVAPRYEQAEARRKGRPGRRRRPGAGRKFSLDLADRLLMLLIYYRTYVTHAFLGFLFGVDQSSVCRNINPLQPLLAGIFRVPERRVELGEGEVRELFFDATEQQVCRPGPGRGQRAYYSGKKKRHTAKHQVVVVRRRKRPGPARKGEAKPRRVRVAAVSPLFPGSTHDKRAYDRTRVVVPPGVRRSGDTAYKGTPLRTPHRRPPKGQLTARQKRSNRRLSRRRVVAEHAIGKMKIWRVASDRYRNPLRRHTLIVKNVAGLHNLMFS